MAEPEDELEPQHMYEARDEKMVSVKDGKTKWRIARFLLPVAKNVEEAAGIPHTPLLSDIFPHNLHQWPLKVVSKGWNNIYQHPHRKWREWVHRLAPKYEPLWIQTGIRDAIINSTYELRYNQEILLGLIEFWCTQTNTFVFPWGEATVTLEDVMILGGYPLVGELVNCPLTLTDDLDLVRIIVQGLEKCTADFLKSTKTKRADHASAWLNHFMEEERSKYEHAAFLSLWLCRYAFPSLSNNAPLDSHVFAIAAKLSLGIRVALGPAILANLYHKLRDTQDAFESSLEETVVIPGHFHLLQVWAFERFPALVLEPKSPMTVIGPGEPRMARWHKVNLKLNIPLIRSALRLPENFEWRPYAADLKNWHHRSFYKEKEQLVFDCLNLDEELLSYVRCLRVSELVGTDGYREKYFPNRVAMQFGMDQDLPAAADVLDFNSTSEIVSIFVPSRSFQSGVSLRYSNWWKDSMITRDGAIKDALSQTRNSKDLRTSAVQANENEEDCHSPVAYGMPEPPIKFIRTWKNSRNSGSPSSFLLGRPSKTKRKIVHESSDGPTKRIDFLSSSVRESVGKGKFSARKTENLQEEATFESVNCVAREWVTKVSGGPVNPIDVDEDSDNSTVDDFVLHASSKSSKPGKDLERRIQKLEKILGVN